MAAVAALALGLAGCGNDTVCASEVVVVFASLVNGTDITTDTGAAPGIQIDVPVHSNLRQGEGLALTVVNSAGEEVGTYQAESDVAGDAVFAEVDVPGGAVTLRVVATSDKCGIGTANVAVNVIGQVACDLSIREGFAENDFYAPLPVLNAERDSDPVLPNFQANIDVQAGGGFAVELFVLDVDSAQEISAGTVTADDTGLATFPLTLAQGRQALRAACKSASGAFSLSSVTQAVFVDTEVPACDLVNPAAGASIIPALDTDNDPANGTQVELLAAVQSDNNDVAGELAVFSVNGVETEVPVTGNGDAALAATFTDVGNYELGFRAQDHAGNQCSVTRTHGYVTTGCDIAFVGPQQAVTEDVNNDPADGLQSEILVQVDPQCAGQTVTTDCGLGTATATAPGAGITPIPVTLCSTAVCEVTETCAVSVTSPAGITTSVGATIIADNLAPSVSLQLVSPAVPCGGVITQDADVDGNALNGVQIDVRVVSPFAAVRTVDVTGASGTQTTVAGQGGDARVTVDLGTNNLVAAAEDQYGNRRTTAGCAISVQDIAVGFDPGLSDGLVGGNDGIAGAGDLTLDLCGTVSEAGASIDVSIDGGAPQAATVTGTTWCLAGVTLAESPPAHVIVATATAGPRAGIATLALTVDLTPPDPVTDLVLTAPTRQSVNVSWTAPGSAGAAAERYLIKIATVPLDDANFASTGTELAGPIPGTPGSAETLLIESLDAGTEYYVGVAALDPAGNRALVASLGPAIPDFDATGAILPVRPDDGDNSLGFQMAAGDFNGDGYSDVALAAPTKIVGPLGGAGAVYIYFGSATGPGNPVTPDVILEGTEVGGQFGYGLTALQWGGDAADDLAVSAPFADNSNGRVYIFHGGATLGTQRTATSADAIIGVQAGGWFDGGGMGWSLAAARFDSDAYDDLAIGVTVGGGGNGGIAVVYGGSGATSILLSENDPAASNGATTLVIRDPQTAVFDFFANWLVNLGRTEGAGDPDDDLGVAYLDGRSVYVIRGRQKPASPGVTLAGINLAADLEIQDDSTDTQVYFGSAMGSIADQNGDGARDLVIGSWAEGTNNGRVRIVDGDATGTRSVAAIALATITPAPGLRFFGTAVANNAMAVTDADINNDGLEDLLIVGGREGTAVVVSLFIWYGGGIPAGSVSSESAHHVIPGPAVFRAPIPPSGGTPMSIMWAGDVNGDGLEDICWADSLTDSVTGGTGGIYDGAFEILWDDGI